MAEARERCEMEQAGRILRAQATRKQVFLTILPLLTDALIKPAQQTPKGTRKAHKDYRVIKAQVSELREALDDPDAFMAMTNVIEQACNHFLETESWPTTRRGSCNRSPCSRCGAPGADPARNPGR